MNKSSSTEALTWHHGSVSDCAKNEHYQVVDICKFLFAFLVVMIHISPFSSFDSAFAKEFDFVLRQGVCRIADPFYFIAAGFLLFRKLDIYSVDSEITKNYVFKILRLYGLWTILLLLGGSGQLWFLGGLAIAVMILFVLLKHHVPVKVIALFSILLYAIGVLDLALPQYLPNVLNGSCDRLDFTCKFGLVMGVPYVFLGLIFSKKHIVLSKFQAMFGCVASFCLMILEAYTLKELGNPKDYCQLIMLYPFSFFLFYIVTHIKLKDSPVYKKLRIVGMIIFYAHLFLYSVVRIVATIIAKFGGWIGILAHNSLVQFSATILLGILAGLLIENLSKKEKFSFLRYLYS